MKPGNDLPVAGLRLFAACVSLCVNYLEPARSRYLTHSGGR
jgi:hypothetical protein